MSIRRVSKWLKQWSSYLKRAKAKPRHANRRRSIQVEELGPRIVLNSDWYTVPGSSMEEVSVTFKRSLGSTLYRNELGVYVVSDNDGRIDGLLPSDEGYAEAVSRQSRSLFSTSSKAGATANLKFAGGTRLGFYLVQNSTLSNWKSKNPENLLTSKPVMFFSFDNANPDSFDHVRVATVGSETKYRWEDRTAGADRDFNDMIYTIKSERPKTFVPGAIGQMVPTTFTLASTGSSFKNEVGLFVVDDASGKIGGISPGQPGYTQAALTSISSQVLFARGAKRGTLNTVDLPSGKYFGLYLVQNTTTSNFLATNPGNAKVKGKSNVFFSFTNANPDKLNHLRWSTVNPNTFGFEDLYGGGDKDFNDLVAKFKFGIPYQSNTQPRISDLANQTVSINAPVGPLSFSVDDDETSSDQLTVTAISSNPTLIPNGNIFFGGSGNNRNIILNPVTGQTGVATITLTVKDPQGLTAFDTFVVTVNAGVIPSSGFAGNTAFLYSGSNPVQTGVVLGTITPTRAAVIRGKVIDRASQSLSGATVSVLNHPEFGQTTTQADGSFSLAVNGGGLLTVVYNKDGFLTVQSQVNVPWQDYVFAPVVALTPLDNAVTTINLNSSLPIQVAQGSVVTDSDGSRQATLLFPQGTSATMTLPNGTIQPLTSLNVRATEYTVGDTGFEAMPGTLPAASAYTYCIELSVDEAQAVGATQVDFSQPIPFYVQNFLNFPVGMAVPVGNYVRESGQWIASPNGVVIKVLSITSGEADLDTNGDGNADDDTLLANFGITNNEQMELANLYQPGQSLWRVSLTHFSPWDLNWPFGLPADAVPPKFDEDDLKDKPTDNPNEVCQASTIGIENQTLGESIQITGTPFSLNYSSDRTSGNLAARTLTIPLTTATYPASMLRVELSIEVAGRQFQQSYSPAPNLNTTFTWDGLDTFGRVVEGSALATIRIIYVYPGVYGQPVPSVESFGLSSGVSIEGNLTRAEISLVQTLTEYIGTKNATTIGMGGWTLDVLNSYDPLSKTLNYGNGHSLVVENVQDIITTFAGIGDYNGFSDDGDGGPATMAQMGSPDDVAVGPDGSLYIAYSFPYFSDDRIRRVSPEGIITTVAGIRFNSGFSGDGGPATQALLSNPTNVAVGSDGSVYISDNLRIRKISPDGIITTIGGTGEFGFEGDGGPATQAQFIYIRGLAVGPDGSLYFGDQYRIRRIGPDGIINTIAGTGEAGADGDGGPATQAQFLSTNGVATGSDGSLYIADDQRIRRISPDGIIITIAGTGEYGFGGDGGPAIQAQLGYPEDVAVGPDGSIYFSDAHRIRRVSPNGIINTIAGQNELGFSGDNGPAAQAHLQRPRGITVDPEGNLYIADFYRIRRITESLPGFTNTDILVPSKDGTELYSFDANGRHLQTFDALTHAVIYTFSYDTAGHLSSVTDGDGNVTLIERDAGGIPTAIVSPFGQRTTLTLNTQGYLASVTNPANETVKMGYGTGGLLTSYTDARDNVSTMVYDGMGRLIYDQDDAGGSTTLVRERLGNGGYKVTTTNGVNGTRQYLVENLPDDSVRRTVIDGRGFATVTVTDTDGTETTTLSDGTVSTTIYGPDPRFGMMSPVITKQIVALPSGLTSTTTATRTAVFSDPLNPQSNLVSLTDTTTTNGQTFTTEYIAATHTITTTSAEGRMTVTTLDDHGRARTIQVPGITPTHYSYDSNGMVSTISQGSRTVTYSYDTLGRLESVTDPISRVIWLAYDAANRIVSKTQPDGSVIGYSYDSDGNMLSLTPPGKPATTFTYDPHDELISSTPPSIGAGDDTTSYVYNLAHQVITEKLPGGDEINYTYCECGRLTSIAAPWGTYTYNYSDTTGDLSSLQSPGGFTLSFGQDGFLGTSETMSGPVSGSVSWTYNHNFQVTSESVNGANPVSFSYDNDGLLIGAGDLTITRDSANGRAVGTVLGAVSDSIGYDQYGDANSYQASIGGTGAFQVTYTRDAIGRITKKIETISGTTVTYDYGYDLNGQLVSVDQDGVRVQTYVYDSNGNRLSLSTPGGTEHGTYNAQDQLLTYGTKSYTYAPDGSLESVIDSSTSQTTHYTYDAFGNLTQVILPDGRTINYLIDGHNRRVGKEVNGVLTQGMIYDGQLTPVATLNSDGSVAERFVYAGGTNVPAYMIKAGVTYRIVTDNIGSVRIVVNTATGTVAQRMDYDVFGRISIDTNPGFQPFGYAGGLYDKDSELVRFGTRDYDSVIGRWNAKDAIGFRGGAVNIYGYVLNNPVTLTDSYGLSPDELGAIDYAKQAHDIMETIESLDNLRSLLRGERPSIPNPNESLVGPALDLTKDTINKMSEYYDQAELEISKYRELNKSRNANSGNDQCNLSGLAQDVNNIIDSLSSAEVNSLYRDLVNRRLDGILRTLSKM